MDFLLFPVLYIGFIIRCLTGAHRGVNTSCYQYFPLMTTSNGAPVATKFTSMSVGPAGPLLMQDFVLLDDLGHFVRERIPERVVHANGAGAFGSFEVINTDFSKYCKASLFTAVGKKTNVAVRFSTFIGESGSPETVRDIKGFAVKFYTDDGNWDLVGSHVPTSYVRDPLLFPSLVHALKRHPRSHLPDPNMYWDFMSQVPESTLTVMFLHTDRGLPKDYRHLNGYGVHTYKVVNAEGIPFYCKFGWRSIQGLQNWEPKEAEKIAGNDPNYATRDLFNAIEHEELPSWSFYFQIMTFAQAVALTYNPFDSTKIWPQKEFPLYTIGLLTLTKNPVNYFTDVEQMAFSPSNLVPGIEPSPDKMLQARLVAYPDAQRYRLGVNYQQLPINCPFQVMVINNQRDGRMCFTDNQGNTPNYFPNSYDGLKTCPAAEYSKWTVTGNVARHLDIGDPYSQCITLWTVSMNDTAMKSHMISNICLTLKLADRAVQDRVIANFKNVHVDLAKGIAAGINVPFN